MATVVLAILIGAAGCGGDRSAAARGGGTAHLTTTTAAPATSTTAAATTTTIPQCRTSQLSLSSGGSSGAGGTSYSTYYLADRGTQTCSLTGYPGVAVLNAQGSVVQRPATRAAIGTHGPIAVTTVVLSPGQRAQFLVTSVDTVPNPDCASEYTGTTLRVYPPDQTAALTMPFDGGFCDLGVGPVQAS